jgi:hypothetical protein
VPAETLIDNLKTGVLSRAGGTVRWHPAYEEPAGDLGFRPLAFPYASEDERPRGTYGII